MFRDLIPLLADRFHIVAPDLPGFGHSDMPCPALTPSTTSPRSIDRFTEVVGFDRYAVYVFDYGAPTGFRLAVKHPERITAIISQNGNAYEEGLSDGWNPIRAYWQDAVAGQPRGAARLPDAGDDASGSTRTASPTRRRSLRTATRSTTSTWRGRAPTRCSSTCSATTRATSRSTRPSRSISAPTSRRCWPSGARTIRSSCRRAPRRSSATCRTPSCASSTPATSRWRPTPRRSRRRSATSANFRLQIRRPQCRSQLPSSPAPARASVRRPRSVSPAISRRWSWSRATVPIWSRRPRR